MHWLDGSDAFWEEISFNPEIPKFDENAPSLFASRLNCFCKKSNFGRRQKVNGTSREFHDPFCPKVSRALECKGFSVKPTFSSVGPRNVNSHWLHTSLYDLIFDSERR